MTGFAGMGRTEPDLPAAAIKDNAIALWPRYLAFVTIFILYPLIAGGCDRAGPLVSFATPVPEVVGQLVAWDDNTPVAGRHVAICQSIDESKTGRCDLIEPAAISDNNGMFQISGIPTGIYFVLYDSGLSDFDTAFELWKGETIHLGNKEWMSEFLGVDLSEEWLDIHLPEGFDLSTRADWLTAYCTATLLIGNSPFIVAHEMEGARDLQELHCLQLNVTSGQTTNVEVPVVYFDADS